MSQQTVDLKASEPENGQTGLPGDPKQQPVAVKKIPLRDLPNENNVVVSKSTGNSMLPKEGDIDGAKVVGTKRPSPDSPANPSHHQSPGGGNSVNGHLVYVRRKAETEAGKNSTEDMIPDDSANPSQPKQVVTQPQQVITEEKAQPKESSVPCLPISAPISSIPHSMGNTGKSINMPAPSESPSHPVTSSALPSSDQKRMNNQNWEERYIQLQMFLKKLEYSSLEEYLEKLRALPAAELSRHAVELENRAIQLSLEEGYELKRVKTLDVLGKSKTSKAAMAQPEPLQS